MPSVGYRYRYQAALLWARTGTDNLGRHTVAATPVEIRVRLNDTQAETTDGKGDTILLDATATVDRNIEVGSRLALGTLLTWDEAGSAARDSGLYEVKTYNQTGDRRNRGQYREVGLMRFHNP